MSLVGERDTHRLVFTGSASLATTTCSTGTSMSPSLGAGADTVLAKIRGAAAHGGGVQVPQGSAAYQKFERYIDFSRKR